MADWQPMETAPKDGTFVQLFDPVATPPVSVGCWDQHAGMDGAPGWLIAEADFMPTLCRPRCWALLLPRPDIAPGDNAENAKNSDIVAKIVALRNAAPDLIAKARRVDALEAALRTIIEHFDGRAWGTDGPGHAHKVPGVWDVTGKDCKWCTEWNAARAALKENTDADL